MTNSVESEAAELRFRVLRELRDAGFERGSDGLPVAPEGDPKLVARRLHSNQRKAALAKNAEFIRTWEDRLLGDFASGVDVDPARIQPWVEPVADARSAALFRYASLHWSVPVSQGYGRRTRFLVRDRQNGKLVGLFALGDPVFNLTARDQVVGWSSDQRRDRLYNVLDAFVLGATGVYRQLIGGKLVAMCAVSESTLGFIVEKYSGTTTHIMAMKKDPRPVLITTTSALGRSSTYNRLKFNEQLLFRPAGYTVGYGHFQFSDGLFADLVVHVKDRNGNLRGNRFGEGPNWKIRTLREALKAIGLPPQLLRHGLQRQVFLAPLGRDWRAFLRSETDVVDWYRFEIEELAEFFRSRWAVPRSERYPDYRGFDREEMRLTPALDQLELSGQLKLST